MEEEELIGNCKKIIEEKIGWGESQNWSNQDFEELSQKIFETTAVTLSPTTLKRIWGKVKYESVPTLTTLNTLARFIGYEQWRTFRQRQFSKNTENILKGPIPVEEAASEQEVTSVSTLPKKSSILPVTIAGLCLLTVVIGYFFSLKPGIKSKAQPGIYRFTSRKVLNVGVPNSVVFDYDVSDAPVDSIFIQQSWDKLLSTRVPKNQTQHTSIYYYPGFFRAKLRVGTQVVKEHDVFIPTDGWLSMIEQKPIPVYFKRDEVINAGKMSLTAAKIKLKNVALQPDPPYVNYSNIREFGDLKTDNFILETSVKNNYEEGSNICQKTEIRILCEGSMISIPLSAKGCISENNLFCLGKYLKGTENDLSGFGVNFNEFVKVRLEVLNGNAKFFINNKFVYNLEGVKITSKIVGIIFRFQGTGSVDWVKLMKADGVLVYDDEF